MTEERHEMVVARHFHRNRRTGEESDVVERWQEDDPELGDVVENIRRERPEVYTDTVVVKVERVVLVLSENKDRAFNVEFEDARKRRPRALAR